MAQTGQNPAAKTTLEHKKTQQKQATQKSARRSGGSIIPAWVFFPGALALAFLALPVLALLGRVPWTRAWEQIISDQGREAIWLSLSTCTVSTLCCVVLGVPAAFLLAKSRRATWLIRALVLLPMTLPPVVAGIALLSFLGRRSALGGWLFDHGVWIAFTPAAVVLAQMFVSLPFLIVAVEGAVRALDPGLEITALSLGARPGKVFVRITLGQVLPALASGTALCFARALGEFGATLTFAGSVPGSTRTLPLAIYLLRETDTDLSLSLAAALLFIALCLVGLSAVFTARARGRTGSWEPGAGDEETAAAGREALGSGQNLWQGHSAGKGPDQSGPTDSGLELAPEPPAPLTVALAAPGRFTGSFTLDGGKTLAVVGPNGAGKSSLLLGLMGLGRFGQIAVKEAEITLGQTVLDSAAGSAAGSVAGSAADSLFQGAQAGQQVGRAKHLPPWQRQIALLTQNPRLFPHMSVLDNVLFGLGGQRDKNDHCGWLAGRQERKNRALAALRAVGMEEYAHRYPHQISGGQAARVALVRALLTRPRLLLLDEPFAALDVASAAKMRVFLSQLAGQMTTVLVSHSLLDVAALADQILVVEGGSVADQGPARTLLSQPTNSFVAGLAGANLWWSAASHSFGPGIAQVDLGVVSITGQVSEKITKARVLAAFPPEALAVSRAQPESSVRNVYRARVLEITQVGPYLQLTCGILGQAVGMDMGQAPEKDAGQGMSLAPVRAQITGAAASELKLEVGTEVWLSLKATQVRLYAAKQ